MLYTIISLLVGLWLIGLLMHVGGALIHALLVLAAAVFVFNLITGKKPL